ncbi:MAG: aminopeptidase P family protein [Clostridia bacterium]|nr:aminopeptidase P family protein [Clostridia bacterium]
MEKSFFRANRKALAQSLDDVSVAVFSTGYAVSCSADENYPFQVNTNAYYLTGITQENVYLVLIKKDGVCEERLYIDAYDEQYAKWIGHRLTKKEASALSGVAMKNIRYRDAFDTELEALVSGASPYLDLETNRNTNFNSFGLSMRDKYQDKAEVKDAYPLIISLRYAKKPCEVEEINKAIAVTKKGIEALMENARPGMKEYELEAYFDFVLKREGQHKFAFTTIAASGVNATTLHYSENNTVMEDGDLVLFDLGAKSNGYSADITRTFPVNGKFTPLQRTVYEIVLSANKKVAEVARAGMTMGELQKVCVEVLTEGCLKAGLIKTAEEIKRVYFHGVSHSLGLDTHDPNVRNTPLPVGAVITNEPGLYFPEHKIGIRIEDDLLITKTGCVNLSADIIKEVDDVEAFMAK